MYYVTYIYCPELIAVFFFNFTFTLYPANNRVGIGNLVQDTILYYVFPLTLVQSNKKHPDQCNNLDVPFQTAKQQTKIVKIIVRVLFITPYIIFRILLCNFSIQNLKKNTILNYTKKNYYIVFCKWIYSKQRTSKTNLSSLLHVLRFIINDFQRAESQIKKNLSFTI